MTPAQKKTSQEHAAKAEAVDMAPGFALYNASLPEKSNKRKHSYTIEEVARKDNDVSEHQDRRDADEFVKHMFKTTKDNPQRMGRVVDRVFKHPAMQRHLLEKHTVKHSESEQVATQLGNNFQKKYVEKPASNFLCQIWPCRLSSRP